MKLRSFVVCLTGALGALGAPALASAGSTVYVATAIGEIYAVDVDPVDVRNSSVTLLHQTGLMGGVFDLEMCADQRLYVSAGDRIVRLRRNGAEWQAETIFNNLATVTALSEFFPGGITCDSSGNLLIAPNNFQETPALWRLNGVTTTPAESLSAPESVTTVNGRSEEVLVLHDGRIATVSLEGRVNALTRRFEESTPIVATTAGEAPIGIAQSSAGEFIVAEFPYVSRYDSAGTFLGSSGLRLEGTAPEFIDDAPFYVDLAMDGTIYATGDLGLWRIGQDGSVQLVASIPFARGVAVDRLSDRDVRTLTFTRSARTATVQYGNATVLIRYNGTRTRPVEVQLERRLVAPASLEAQSPRSIDPIAFPGDSGFTTVLTVRRSTTDDDNEDGHRGRGKGSRDDEDGDGHFDLAWAFNFDGTLGRLRLMAEEERRKSPVFDDELSFFSRDAGDKDLVGAIRGADFGRMLFLANDPQTRRR